MTSKLEKISIQNIVNSKPLISIIIPLYNRAELIAHSLDSIQEQSYENWECIVVDDHSSDNSLEVIKGYSQKDSRFKILIRSENQQKGANSCRNIGVKHSKGRYIIFLDSDDLLHPDCLNIRTKKIKEFPDYDFWVFTTELFKSDPGDLNTLLNIHTEESPLERFLKMDILWLSTGPIWKKESLVFLNGWDEELKSWQDWDLSVRALINRLKYKYFNIIDNYWRTFTCNNLGLSSTSPRHLKSHYYLISKIKDNSIKKDLYTSRVKFLINNLFFWLARRWLRFNNLSEALKVVSSKNVGFAASLKFTCFILLLRIRYVRFFFTQLLKIFNHPSNQLFNASTFKKIKAKIE